MFTLRLSLGGTCVDELAVVLRDELDQTCIQYKNQQHNYVLVRKLHIVTTCDNSAVSSSMFRIKVTLSYTKINLNQQIFCTHTLLMKFVETFLGERSSNLQSLRNHRRSDQLVADDLLIQLLVGWLVEEYQVV